MAYPLPDVSSEDYNAAQAAKFAAATQPVLDHLDTSPDTPPPDPTLSPNQQTVKTGGTPSLRSRNLISNQFDYQADQELTPAEAASACGPVASLAFARYAGRNPTIGEALAIAKKVGWSPSLGMAGPQSEVSLLGQLGVHSQYNQGAGPQDIAAEVQAGRPVIVDTPNHYYAIDDYNAQTGLFHVGGSGLALRGGSEWMSWQQIAAHGGGARGSITIQSAPGLAQETPASQPAPGVSMAAPAAVSSPTAGAPLVSFESYARQALATIDQTVQGIGDQPDATSQRANVANSPISPHSPTFETFARGLMATLDGGGSPQNAPQTRGEAAPGTQQAPGASQVAVPGYNDMAGALSSPIQPYSSQYGQPAGFQAPQAAPLSSGYDDMAGAHSWQPDYRSLPGYGGVQPEPGANPLVNIPAAIGQGAIAANDYLGDQQAQGFAAFKADPSGHVTPEQVQAMGERVATGLSILTPGGTAAGEAAGEAERAGNILLRKYVSPEVQQVIADAAAKDPAAMEAARRGVVSDETVQELAQAAGTTVQKVIQRWKPGQAANAETLTAMRSALQSKATDVANLADAAQAAPTTENLLGLQLGIREHQAIQEAVSGVTAEAGRSLRALRMSVTSAVQSGNADQMSGLLNRLGGTEWTADLASKLSQLDRNDPTQVYTFLRDIAKPKAADYVNEWLYNAMLSSPSTHVANFVSNTINAIGGVIERETAAAIDAPLAALQRRPRGRFFGEASADAYGLLQGIPEGVRAATYALQHGFTEAEAVKGEMPRVQAFRGPVGNVINAPSRALNAADAFMRPILQRGALNAEIYRRAASEGLSGQALTDRITELTTNVPADLMAKASQMAEYQLYRQAPKTTAKSLTQWRGMKIAGIEPLRFVIPFVQVPVNATKYGLERTPLGLLNPDLWKNLAAKDPAAADNLARVAQGSFIAAGIGALVGSGNLDITGAVPTAPAQRDAFYRQGKLPFALKIGGTWYQYQRWEPMNHALTQVAAAVDAIRNAKQGMPPSEIAGQAALTIAQNISSQNFLSGMNSLLNALSDPQRYGPQLVQQLATAPLPFSAGMRAVANVVDPRQRAPSGVVQDVESAIPGLSQNVPARLNNYGEGETQPNFPLLPYKWQAANNSPIEAELARYKVEPGATGKTLRGLDLTPDEARAYQVVSGQSVKRYLEALVNAPEYRGLSDYAKARALQIAITRAKDAGANQYVGQLVQQQGQDAIVRRIQQKKQAAVPAGR